MAVFGDGWNFAIHDESVVHDLSSGCLAFVSRQVWSLANEVLDALVVFQGCIMFDCKFVILQPSIQWFSKVEVVQSLGHVWLVSLLELDGSQLGVVGMFRG